MYHRSVNTVQSVHFVLEAGDIILLYRPVKVMYNRGGFCMPGLAKCTIGKVMNVAHYPTTVDHP